MVPAEKMEPAEVGMEKEVAMMAVRAVARVVLMAAVARGAAASKDVAMEVVRAVVSRGPAASQSSQSSIHGPPGQELRSAPPRPL